MKVILTDVQGKEKEIVRFRKLVLKEEEGVPAHTLLVRFDNDAKDLLAEIAFMRLEKDGKVIFDGIADTITEIYTGSSWYFEVFGRNRASLLLDNEVKPAVYSNPTSEQICRQFLNPYGFEDYQGGTAVYNGIFNIAKGKSPWDIIESFCKTCYESVPYCSPDNRIYFDGLPSLGNITFGAGGQVDYSEYRIDIKRHMLISSVSIKRSENEDYTTEIFSSEAENRQVQRKRYLNASNTQFTPIYCAEKMIENGINNSRIIALKCPCVLTDCLGFGASVNLKGTLYEELKICGLQVTVAENEINTVVELRGSINNVDN